MMLRATWPTIFSSNDRSLTTYVVCPFYVSLSWFDESVFLASSFSFYVDSAQIWLDCWGGSPSVAASRSENDFSVKTLLFMSLNKQEFGM